MKNPGQQPHPTIQSSGDARISPPQPNQVEMPATPPPQPDQVAMPPGAEPMELDIPEDIPDLTDIPEEMLLDFDAWAHNVLHYEW